MATATTPTTQTVPLAEFLEATRMELCERATGLLAPQYTADLHRPAAEKLAQLNGRSFLSAQVDIAAALNLALNTHQSAFCIGEQGTGKAQPLYSQILTPTGWTPMGQLKVGNYVFGQNGQPTQIIGVFPQGKKPVYRVSFTDGSSTECCAEHLWSVSIPTRKYRNNAPEVLPLKEILQRGVKYTWGHKYYIPTTQPITFPEQDQPIDPYILGVLLGDGWLGKDVVGFSTVDTELRKEVARLLPKGLSVVMGNRTNTWLITKGHRGNGPNPYLDATRMLGLAPTHSETKFIPDLYKFGSVDQRSFLLQGLLDTDGYVEKNGKFIEFSTISPRLKEDMVFLVQSLGGIARVATKIPTYTYKGEKRTGQLSYRITITLPTHIQPFRLSRKLNRCKPRTKYRPVRAITSIEPCGETETQCIQVAASNGLYLTDHCIVTHNTQIALGTAALHGAKRMLVLTPPHLVSTWERKEIRPVWPNAHVVTLKTLGDLRKLPSNPATPLIALLSREPAKLGPVYTPAAIKQRLRFRFKEDEPFQEVWACPNCYRAIYDEKENYLTNPAKAPQFCKTKGCGASLWTVKHRAVHGGPAPQRVPLARHILRTLPGFFDLLIVDEVHEYQGQDTLQGEAMGHLVEACGATLGLTGTLFNGYASSLFPILWRTHPDIQKSFDFHSNSKWVTQYGLWDKRTRVIPDTTTGTTNGAPRTKTKRDVRERPGASPALLIPFLDRTAFVRMKDLHQHLPPYSEDVLSVEMTPAQRQTYGRLQTDLMAAIQTAINGKRWGRVSLYMTTLMTWPDRCWISEPAQYHEKFQEDGTALPPVLPPGLSYPKEKLLIELIHREKAAGRKVLIYVSHTGKRDLTARFQHLCEQAGLKTDILTVKVKPEHRLDWLEARTPHLDALICQPRLVATGYTLNEYPTIVFTEPDYAIYTLRQAARRSWRLGQTKPVKVYYLSYMHTAQEQAWSLVARKLKASLLIEGDLDQTSEGLASFHEEGDFLIELAKQITQSGSDQATPDSLRALFNQCRDIEGIPDQPIPTPEPIPVEPAVPDPVVVATLTANAPEPSVPEPSVPLPRIRVKSFNPLQLELF